MIKWGATIITFMENPTSKSQQLPMPQLNTPRLIGMTSTEGRKDVRITLDFSPMHRLISNFTFSFLGIYSFHFVHLLFKNNLHSRWLDHCNHDHHCQIDVPVQTFIFNSGDDVSISISRWRWKQLQCHFNKSHKGCLAFDYNREFETAGTKWKLCLQWYRMVCKKQLQQLGSSSQLWRGFQGYQEKQLNGDSSSNVRRSSHNAIRTTSTPWSGSSESKSALRYSCNFLQSKNHRCFYFFSSMLSKTFPRE